MMAAMAGMSDGGAFAKNRVSILRPGGVVGRELSFRDRVVLQALF